MRNLTRAALGFLLFYFLKFYLYLYLYFCICLIYHEKSHPRRSRSWSERSRRSTGSLAGPHRVQRVLRIFFTFNIYVIFVNESTVFVVVVVEDWVVVVVIVDDEDTFFGVVHYEEDFAVVLAVALEDWVVVDIFCFCCCL